MADLADYAQQFEIHLIREDVYAYEVWFGGDYVDSNSETSLADAQAYVEDTVADTGELWSLGAFCYRWFAHQANRQVWWTIRVNYVESDDLTETLREVGP